MIEIIPAIDIIDGKCVRLSQGDYDSKKVYNENPVEVAKEFEANGVRRLHVVDLDGAASHHVVNYRVLEQIAVRTSLVIDFGGGVKSDEDLKIAFESGAQMVTGGSIAVKDPELFCHWLEIYGSEKIILGADVKEHKIAVNGWKDESACELFPFLENYIDKGIRKVICTDISCDGMLSGPSIDLYKEVLAKFPDLYLMASGGVSKMDDIVALDEAGVPGYHAIPLPALHQNRHGADVREDPPAGQSDIFQSGPKLPDGAHFSLQSHLLINFVSIARNCSVSSKIISPSCSTAVVMVKLSPGCKSQREWLSALAYTLSRLVASATTVRVRLAENTSGTAWMLCAQTGVSTITAAQASSTGPPAESE